MTFGTLLVERRDGSVIALSVEVAKSPTEQAAGLSGRRTWQAQAMAFPIVPPGPVAMHMAGVLYPLDMIFIDELGRISLIVEHVPILTDGTWGPDGLCSLVLEAPAGWARSRGLAGGELVAWA